MESCFFLLSYGKRLIDPITIDSFGQVIRGQLQTFFDFDSEPDFDLDGPQEHKINLYENPMVSLAFSTAFREDVTSCEAITIRL